MDRAIDPLQTIDAKLWADEFMATKQRLGDAEFDHAMMLGWFANAIMRGYDEGKRLGAADAQATIAALQAQLATCFKLSGADPDGNEDWRLAPHAVEEVTRLRNDCDELGDETGALREQLTQRTAELEAAKAIQAIDLKNNNAYREQVANLHAELERVRGQYAELGKMVLALPKVEGEIEIKRCEGLWYVWVFLPHGSQVMCGRFRSQLEAESYAAIVKHRQGME